MLYRHRYYRSRRPELKTHVGIQARNMSFYFCWLSPLCDRQHVRLSAARFHSSSSRPSMVTTRTHGSHGTAERSAGKRPVCLTITGPLRVQCLAGAAGWFPPATPNPSNSTPTHLGDPLIPPPTMRTTRSLCTLPLYTGGFHLSGSRRAEIDVQTPPPLFRHDAAYIEGFLNLDCLRGEGGGGGGGGKQVVVTAIKKTKPSSLSCPR